MRYLILLGLLVFTSLCLSQKSGYPIQEQLIEAPQGYVEAEIHDVQIERTGSLVFIKKIESNLSLRIHVSRSQGENIYMALHNLTFGRPLTHDLIVKFLETSGMRIKYIRIDRLEDGVYYATIIAARGKRDIVIDARPSDSIVLALKVGAPIYVEESLLGPKKKVGEEFPEVKA